MPESKAVAGVRVRVEVLVKCLHIIATRQQTVSDRNREYRIVGEPAAGLEKLELNGLASAKLVNRANDVSSNRSQHGGCILRPVLRPTSPLPRTSAKITSSYRFTDLPSLFRSKSIISHAIHSPLRAAAVAVSA